MGKDFLEPNNSKHKIHNITGQNIGNNNAMLPRILREVKNAFVVLDSKCEFIMCNQSAYEMLGCESEQELLGQYRTKWDTAQDGSVFSQDVFLEHATKACTDKETTFDCTANGANGNPVQITVNLL